MAIARPARLVVLSGLVLASLTLATGRGEAHKPITSKYTYNDDVFPIFRDRCSRCHVTGGVAPMSLMTYEEAFPWAESIRAELVTAHMPPANPEEGFGSIRKAFQNTKICLLLTFSWPVLLIYLFLSLHKVGDPGWSLATAGGGIFKQAASHFGPRSVRKAGALRAWGY